MKEFKYRRIIVDMIKNKTIFITGGAGFIAAPVK